MRSETFTKTCMSAEGFTKGRVSIFDINILPNQVHGVKCAKTILVGQIPRRRNPARAGSEWLNRLKPGLARIGSSQVVGWYDASHDQLDYRDTSWLKNVLGLGRAGSTLLEPARWLPGQLESDV